MKPPLSWTRLAATPTVLLVLLATATARPVRMVTPDELLGKAGVVVNGLVEDVTVTDKTSELVLGSNAPVPVKIAEARVKRLAAFVGETDPVFTFRFPVVDSGKMPLIVNGPFTPSPEKGKRYRFYLKREGAALVSVLDGEFDSGFALHELADGETDDSPPLLKKEAEVLARQHFRRIRQARPETIDSFSGNTWRFDFFTGPPLGFPSFSYDAQISVTGARSIDPKSWIGAEKPRKAEDFSTEDLKKLVRLTVEGDFREGRFEPANGLITSLIGVIDEASEKSLTGTFVSVLFDAKDGAEKLTFPRKNLASVQRLSGE